MNRPFKVLGVQQIAIGALNKQSLKRLWVDLFGLSVTGHFLSEKENNIPEIWIAGGIGITPFLAMSKALGSEQEVDLYYSVKTASEAVYLDELRKVAKAKSNLKIIPFEADKQGFITADYIFKTSRDLDDANFMICGPVSLMHALKAQLKSKGVAKRNINTEEFNLT